MPELHSTDIRPPTTEPWRTYDLLLAEQIPEYKRARLLLLTQASKNDIMESRMNEPKDLSVPAIKAARRLQSLPDGQIHRITLIKKCGEWLLTVEGGPKVEQLK